MEEGHTGLQLHEGENLMEEFLSIPLMFPPFYSGKNTVFIDKCIQSKLGFIM